MAEISCMKCKHRDLGTGDSPCGDCYDYGLFEKAFISQGDRIRAMSDEELAEFLSELIRNASDYITGEGDWLQWLKSEVKELGYDGS